MKGRELPQSGLGTLRRAQVAHVELTHTCKEGAHLSDSTKHQEKLKRVCNKAFGGKGGTYSSVAAVTGEEKEGREGGGSVWKMGQPVPHTSMALTVCAQNYP